MKAPNPPAAPARPADLTGHRALVTGASGNIGAAIARRLAGAGADVVIHYHSNAKGAGALETELRATGVRALCVQADLSQAAGAGVVQHENRLRDAVRVAGEPARAALRDRPLLRGQGGFVLLGGFPAAIEGFRIASEVFAAYDAAADAAN